MRNPRPSPSDPPLFAAGQFMLIWVGFLFMEIIVHTIAGTTAIWYFHRNDDSYDYPSSPAFTALKWSLSSAFGSLAMASFILTVVRIIVMMVRAMEENMREEGGAAAFLACILRCIIETIEAWIQFITKMSTITVAITNDEFWSSCKRTMGMFYRCYLEGIMVERFAKITMSRLRHRYVVHEGRLSIDNRRPECRDPPESVERRLLSTRCGVNADARVAV